MEENGQPAKGNVMQETPAKKRRFVTILVIIVLLLIGVAAVGSLFTQSLVTAEQKHDHDGDGKADH